MGNVVLGSGAFCPGCLKVGWLKKAVLISSLLGLLFAVPAYATNNEIVGAALKSLVAKAPISTGSALADANREKLRAFYASRSFKPVWSRDTGPKGKARALVRELQTSVSHALQPSFYGIKQINTLMASKEPEDLARLDFLLSGALVDYAHDLVNGRATTSGLVDENRVNPVLLDPAKLVEQAAESGNLPQMIAGLVGKDRRYLRLVTKMVEFKRLERNGFWPSGDITKSTKSMRTALSITGDLPIAQATKDGPMDAALIAAIKAYQARNALAADGKIGPATAKALSAPLADRIAKLKVNIERRRWQNRGPQEKLLYINTADTALKLVKNDKTVGEIAVVRDDVTFKALPTFYGSVSSITRSSQSAVALSLVADNAAMTLPADAKLMLAGSTDDNLKTLSAFLAPEDLVRLQSAGPDETVLLKHPIPLFATYLTAWATRDGKLQLRQDRYGRDEALKAKLGL